MFNENPRGLEPLDTTTVSTSNRQFSDQDELELAPAPYDQDTYVRRANALTNCAVLGGLGTMAFAIGAYLGSGSVTAHSSGDWVSMSISPDLFVGSLFLAIGIVLFQMIQFPAATAVNARELAECRAENGGVN